MTAWWESILPPPDTDREVELAELCRHRDSFPVLKTPMPGGPSWSDAVAELDAAFHDGDDGRWDRALQLAWAVWRLEAVLALLEASPLRVRHD